MTADAAQAFEGRVAVVTGAATGIGRACARQLRRRGAAVVPVGLMPADGAPPHQDGLLDGFIAADLTDPARVSALAEEVTRRHGRLDILVNNAGILRQGTVEETTPEEWNLVLASNVTTAYLTSRALLPLMRQTGGSITHISSVHAVATFPRHAAYAASKAALVALARQMAIDYISDGIRVNALLVGSVETAMSVPAGIPEADLAPLREPTRLARMASPDEVAAAVCLVASADASFMTGAAIAVDGGLLTRLSL